MMLSVNGVPLNNMDFWNTGGNDSWAWDRKPVKLQKGINRIRLGNTTGTKICIDHLNVL